MPPGLTRRAQVRDMESTFHIDSCEMNDHRNIPGKLGGVCALAAYGVIPKFGFKLNHISYEIIYLKTLIYFHCQGNLLHQKVD